MPSRIAFSTLAFPDATLAAAVSAGRRWGYSGVELRLIDGELIDPAMPAARRAQVRRTLAAGGLPVVAVDSSIRLTGDNPGPDLRRFLQLASDWEAPLVRVFGGALDPPPARRDQIRAAARVLEEAVPLAARLGVAIGVETHDAFSASSAVAELLALLSEDGVPSDLVGAVWDSHHPHRMGETPAAPRTGNGSWSCSAPARCRSGTCSACWRPGATRTGSRWNGRSDGTRRSRRPRWPFPSTWTCWPRG